MTQKELADVIGLADHSTVARYEQGRVNPRAESIPKIAEALGVPIADLFKVA